MSSARCRFDFHASICRPSVLSVLLTALLVTTAARPAMAGDRETALRRAVAWQAALDAAGFSPGLVDGRLGAKTELATREFQRANGLPVTGDLDKATADALGFDPDNIFDRYTIRPDDMEEIGPCPTSWIAKSKLDRLGHESLDDVLAEKFHCATHLLATLNHKKQINSLGPGDEVIVPRVLEPAPRPKVTRLEVSFTEKIIRAIGAKDRIVGLFHCSIARDKEKLPSHDARVVGVSLNPDYTFRPGMWPEVKENIDHDLRIPPGPRNPVGRCWVALSLPGYGMHGTPNPELIGKTGSHGCFRLANWDAVRLGKMVQGGTPVKFTGRPDVQLASGKR